MTNLPTQDSNLTGLVQTLIDSKKLPSHVKTIEDAITIAQMGKELGFGIMQSFHYIQPIQGKLTLAARALGALLRRGGVKYTTEEDAVYVYEDGSVSEYPSSDENRKFVDRRTTILFYRDDLTERCSFTMRDAKLQGLLTKDNWQRMPKEMMFARCIAKGANRIGPDLLMGLYTTEEMVDTLNINEKYIVRQEDGLITEIKQENE